MLRFALLLALVGALPAKVPRKASSEHRLAGYAVGEGPRMIPGGFAKRVPAGATLSFSMHYTTNGTRGRDRTKIGLVLAKKPPTAEMFMGLINNGLFEIPPGFRKFDPQTLIKRIKQSDVWVDAPPP